MAHPNLQSLKGEHIAKITFHQALISLGEGAFRFFKIKRWRPTTALI